jgi:hypothetical protein
VNIEFKKMREEVVVAKFQLGLPSRVLPGWAKETFDNRHSE